MNNHYWLIGFCALAIQMEKPDAAAAEKPGPAARQSAGGADYTAVVKPFFKAHCIACHGPDKSKGRITVHTLNASGRIKGDGNQ